MHEYLDSILDGATDPYVQEAVKLFRSGEILKSIDALATGDCLGSEHIPENKAAMQAILFRYHELRLWAVAGKPVTGICDPPSWNQQPKFERTYRTLLEHKCKKVLDVGCYTGWFHEQLIYRGLDAYGCDFQLGIDKKLPHRKITICRANELSKFYPDDSFDAVTMLDVLEHIFDDERTLLEASYVIKPGGFLIINVPRTYEGYEDRAYEHLRMYDDYFFVKNLPGCITDINTVSDEYGRNSTFVVWQKPS